ncbi:hypothetical protein XENOCAPTIV_016434 [Xenoophorus captivus]|uniref:Uncharacterized protein n=1 Tax=Xenoophorus captivus TaxID=1517983 RepID=A0ABV0SB15_9TELE
MPVGACRLKKELSDEEPMQTDVGESPYVPGPGENPLYTAEPLTMDDLNLLSDLFYLPYEHGAMARIMLEELDWVKNHRQDAAAQTEEWCGRAGKFDGMCEAVVQMFNRLSNAPNRSVLYDLYNYICDIKSGVGLARTYVKTLGSRGVFCDLRQSNRRMLDFYSKLGSFEHIPMDKSLPQDIVVMATQFQ